MVDIICRYEPLIIKALTMIDPVTGWFKILQYNDEHSVTISNLVDQAWICRYPRPEIILYNRGSLFLGSLFKTVWVKTSTKLSLSAQQHKTHCQTLYWNVFTKLYQTSCVHLTYKIITYTRMAIGQLY